MNKKFEIQFLPTQKINWYLNLIIKDINNERKRLRARLVYVFKNLKLLFKNICENTYEWKSVLKCVKYYLKTENGWLNIQTKHPLKLSLKIKNKKFSIFK